MHVSTVRKLISFHTLDSAVENQNFSMLDGLEANEFLEFRLLLDERLRFELQAHGNSRPLGISFVKPVI